MGNVDWPASLRPSMQTAVKCLADMSLSACPMHLWQLQMDQCSYDVSFAIARNCKCFWCGSAAADLCRCCPRFSYYDSWLGGSFVLGVWVQDRFLQELRLAIWPAGIRLYRDHDSLLEIQRQLWSWSCLLAMAKTADPWQKAFFVQCKDKTVSQACTASVASFVSVFHIEYSLILMLFTAR